MSTAWVFPGQDAFEPTTGLVWSEASQAVARNLAVAEDLVGVPLCDRRARRRLDRFTTAVIQPLLTALCLGIAQEIGGIPDAVAGASLGEIPAWAIATNLDSKAAIIVAAERGQAMQAVAQSLSGGMTAKRGSPEEIAALCTDGVTIGARNGETEWVLTGPTAALARLGGRSVPVVGPWHSPLMAPAAEAFEAALPEAAPVRVPFVRNDGQSTGDARAHLVRQLTRHCDWYATVRGLVALGVTDVVTVGPGRVLRTQLRRIAPQLRVRGTDDPREWIG